MYRTIFLGLLSIGVVLAMPPRPGVKIPKELVGRRLALKLDVPKEPIRDKNKKGLFNRSTADILPLVSGTKKFAVTLMEYPDYAKVYPQNDFRAMLFGSWPSGSAHDYYNEISYGQLDLTGSVNGWFVTDQNRDYYNIFTGNTGDLILEAAQKSDPDVNYADFDNDGDGYVDCFSVIHSGFGFEESGDPSDIWSHMWYLSGWFGSPYTTDDPDPNHPGEYIKIDLYTVEPERSYITNNGSMVCIGVFCHEWGHAFGLPDLYDTDGGGQGLGVWCLMAAGSWGGDLYSPWSPVHLSSWGKIELGWITPTVVSANDFYPVNRVETNPRCYKLWTAGNPSQEYFLIENRQSVGFDQNLYNSGLAIYHIDETVIEERSPTNEVNAGGAYPYGVALEQADGLDHLWNGTNAGDPNDPYPGGTNNTAFDSTGTNPDSRSNSNVNTQCGVNQIPVSDTTMTAYMYIEPEPPELPDIAVQPDTIIFDFTNPGTALTDTMWVFNIGSLNLNVAAMTPSVSWITNLEPVSFTATPSDSVPVAVTVDTAGLPEGIFYGTVSIASDDPDESTYLEPVKLIIPGPPVIAVAPDTVTFDFQGTLLLSSQNQTMWVKNIGGKQLAVASILTGAPWITDIQPASFDVAPLDSQAVYVTASDDGLSPGTYYDSLEIQSSDPTQNPYFEPLKLTKTGLPDIAVKPDTLVYDLAQQNPLTETMWVSNSGNEVLTVNCASPTSWIVSIEPTDFSVSPGDSLSVAVTVDTTGLADGVHQGEVVINNNVPNKNPEREPVMLIKPAGIADATSKLPTAFELSPVRPNPFSKTAIIRYALPRTSEISLTIYDISGKLIKTLISQIQPPGYYTVSWDCRDSGERRVAKGIYFIRMGTPVYASNQKLIVVR